MAAKFNEMDGNSQSKKMKKENKKEIMIQDPGMVIKLQTTDVVRFCGLLCYLFCNGFSLVLIRCFIS